jgi:hypothetical protein
MKVPFLEARDTRHLDVKARGAADGAPGTALASSRSRSASAPPRHLVRRRVLSAGPGRRHGRRVALVAQSRESETKNPVSPADFGGARGVARVRSPCVAGRRILAASECRPTRCLTDLADTRLLVQILSVFGAIALGLAGLGIWGVAAQVGQRTREIGVRVALGATSRQVVRLMAMQGLVPLAAGLAIGLAAGLAVARAMRSVLFQVSPNDPATIAATVAAFAAVGAISTLGPALRAARLDPLAALRE